MRAPWLPPNTSRRVGRRRVGDIRGRDHGLTHRIAGVGCLGEELALAVQRPGETRGDRAHERRQQTIGAAHDAVLLVNDGRNAAQRRGGQRRNRRVAAEPDNGCGPQTAKETKRHRGPATERRKGLGKSNRVAAMHSCARDDVGCPCWKVAAIPGRASVGRKINHDAAPRERRTERLRRKQMAACAAGGNDDQRIAQAGLPAGTRPLAATNGSVLGRSRIRASIMPVP